MRAILGGGVRDRLTSNLLAQLHRRDVQKLHFESD